MNLSLTNLPATAILDVWILWDPLGDRAGVCVSGGGHGESYPFQRLRAYSSVHLGKRESWGLLMVSSDLRRVKSSVLFLIKGVCAARAPSAKVVPIGPYCSGSVFDEEGGSLVLAVGC